MASTNPVPSRAAINALRGVILTTSCSVILLAEERRRRIKIARAAIDNARKLHTVRVNHGPALSESFGRREAWPAELDVPPQLPIAPESKGPVRRRRRNTHASLSTDPVKPIEPKAVSTESQSAIGTSDTFRQEWEEWDATRRELSRVPGNSHMVIDPFLRIPSYEARPLLEKKEMLPMKNDEAEVNEVPTTQSQKERNVLEATPKEALESSAPAPISLEIPSDYEEAMPSLTFSDISESSEVEFKVTEVVQPEAHLIDTKPNQAEAKFNPNQVEQLDESMAELNDLLTKLDASTNGKGNASNQLSSATELFKTLVSARFISPQMAVEDALKLLQCSVKHQQYYNVHTVLKETLPMCRDNLALVAPFVEFLERKNDKKGIRQLFLHYNLTQKPARANPAHECWISSMLVYKWRSTRKFAAVQGFYRLLQDAGLFTDSHLPPLAQYAVRRRIALIALDAGNGAVASAEMEHMKQLRPEGIEVDAYLKGKSIVYEAAQGRWDSVHQQLVALKDIPDLNQAYYQRVLAKLTRMYAKCHSPEQVDIFVQKLIEDCEMELNQTLAFVVADRHGRHRDMAMLIHWLRYCQESGLEFDQPFFNKLSHKCWKYWSFDRSDIMTLFKSLRTFFPWLQEPQLSKYSRTGALDGLLKKPSNDTEPRPSLPQLVGFSIRAFEQNTFKSMNSQALKGDWEEVKKAYDEASDMGLGFSSRCLRLAVVANIRTEGCHSRTAMNLIRQGHAEGHDVSAALVPLLVAQLESGDNAEALISATLEQGVRIHDSVYNAAARSLTRKGQHEAAIAMCKVAAKENGHGDPAYNKFNFATLLLACTRLEWYQDLGLLIERFTSKFLFWHGSKECKESIKLAMKMVALRVAERPDEQHMHEEMLLCLDKALQHVKESRATVRDDRKTLTEGLVDALNPLNLVGVAEEASGIDDGRLASTEPTTEPISAVPVTTETEATTGHDAAVEAVRQFEREHHLRVKDKSAAADYDVTQRAMRAKRFRDEVMSGTYSTAESIQLAW